MREGPGFRFRVPGIPVAKGRPRFGNKRTYTPAKTKEAEGVVKEHARRMMFDQEMYTGPILVACTFYVRTPTSWSKKRQALAWDGYLLPATRPDIDNYVKLVTDAMNEIVYQDDNQIVGLHAAKFYAEPGEECTVIDVSQIDTTAILNTTPQEVH